MSIILAGRFDNTVQVLAVLKDLRAARFGQAEFAGYYVNPPGKYGLYPLAAGKASNVSANTQAGARRQAAGPARRSANGTGSYMENLLESLGRRSEIGQGRDGIDEDAPASLAEPGAGPMVAICVDRPGTEQIARATLHRHGAQAIERTDGRWEDGNWKDFDARGTTPELEGHV